ncbi:MAG TPA: hypothetical protein VGU74_05145 [Gemmatimonadales bacterium]|nr:hypothetical protein [Gemmatimonadales bacterium]
MKRLLVIALALIGQTLSAQADSARTDSTQPDRRARFLIERRCSDCHSVVALKIKAKADVGPDLSAAYADVPFRYGMTLDRFLDQPAGIMRIVLGGRPSLGRAERDSLVALFRDLYTEQLAKQDSVQRRMRPVEGKSRSAVPSKRS